MALCHALWLQNAFPQSILLSFSHKIFWLAFIQLVINFWFLLLLRFIFPPFKNSKHHPMKQLQQEYHLKYWNPVRYNKFTVLALIKSHNIFTTDKKIYKHYFCSIFSFNWNINRSEVWMNMTRYQRHYILLIHFLFAFFYKASHISSMLNR